MEREEHWRLRLLELKKDLDVTQAAMAATIEVDPSYLSRLLYPLGKPGRKNLGLETITALRQKYHLSADWFDLPLGSELPSGSGTLDLKPVAKDPDTVVKLDRKLKWPFHNVTYGRLMDLKRELGPAGFDALRDIDALLEVAVMKWERIASQKKKRGGG